MRLTEAGAFWLWIAGFAILVSALSVAETGRPFRRPKPDPGRRIATNFGLGLINALIVSIIPISGAVAAEWARIRGVGLIHWLGLPWEAAFAVTLLAWTLALYLLHVLAHRVPILWRVHRVHHGDDALDLSTGVRHHPLELLINAALLGGLAILLGADAVAIVAYSIVATGFAFWTHANVALPEAFDRPLRFLLATPAVHRVHHSAARAETDSNYGDVILLWDRLFGTYRSVPRARLDELRIGLGDDYDGDAGNIGRQLLLPFRSSGPAPSGAGWDGHFPGR